MRIENTLKRSLEVDHVSHSRVDTFKWEIAESASEYQLANRPGSFEQSSIPRSIVHLGKMNLTS